MESCSSKIDVYDMKDEGRISPMQAGFVVKQKSQERCGEEVCSYFNSALSLSADYPAAIGRSLPWYRAGVNVNTMTVLDMVANEILFSEIKKQG